MVWKKALRYNSATTNLRNTPLTEFPNTTNNICRKLYLKWFTLNCLENYTMFSTSLSACKKSGRKVFIQNSISDFTVTTLSCYNRYYHCIIINLGDLCLGKNHWALLKKSGRHLLQKWPRSFHAVDQYLCWTCWCQLFIANDRKLITIFAHAM